jgi:hypothetical protein
LPAAVKKSFDARLKQRPRSRLIFEKLLKNEGHLPEDKYLVMSRKGKRLGVSRWHTSWRASAIFNHQ